MSHDPIYDRLATTLTAVGPVAVLTELADYLLAERRYHELFEARKMLVRAQLDLPLLSGEEDETIPAATRQRLEDGLIDACREVGVLLMRAGRLRDAWHYLRAVGDRTLVRSELAEVEPTEENLDEFLELCVQEGFDLARGFRVMLTHYGTCNSITTFDSAMYGRPRGERAIGAGLLVAHLHDELCENVRGHIERQEGQRPAESSLPELLVNRPWLFAGGAYHVDTTHLASVIRFARDLQDRGLLQRALELADYGEGLDPALQYPGDEPFEALFPTSRLYFQALLGTDVDRSLSYFRQRAEAVNPREETTLTIETYIDLLARIGRGREALAEALRLLPEGVQQTGRAPRLLELAEAAGNYSPLAELARRRGDALGYTICLLKAAEL